MQTCDAAQILEQAVNATESFVQVLRAEGLTNWANHFSGIAIMLRQGDVRSAKYSLSNCSYTGPGSLSDVFANDTVAFNKAWGQCASSIRALSET